MVEIVYSDDLPFGLQGFNHVRALHIYNGLDAAITNEIVGKTLGLVAEGPQKSVYDFERALQAPALEMMWRGVRVDALERQATLQQLGWLERRLAWILDQFAHAVWDQPLNPASPKQLQEFFYGRMGLQPVYVMVKGERKISTNREALEKLSERYLSAEPIVAVILALRDARKKIQVLKTGVSADGRMRTSFNIAGTETGRWSSSRNAFYEGTNLQNITPAMRRIFHADPGMKLGYTDLEQAESRGVAYLAQDEAMIRACESEDLHTFCCGIIWPEEIRGTMAEMKKLAERTWYRHFSYRDMSKRGGHACNYVAKPATIAKHLKLHLDVAVEFQRAYFGAFQGIRQWHLEIARQLFSTRTITTPPVLGVARQRTFFGRPDDEVTIREAVAYGPQSLVAQILNAILYRVWKASEALGVQILLQVHDAILYQFPEHLEAHIIPEIHRLFHLPVEIHGREMVIPAETKVGYVWFEDKRKNVPADQLFIGRMEKWVADGRTRNQVRPDRTPAGLLDYRFS